MSINTCTLSGNLTRDPELRATKGGSEIMTFTVAVNDRRKNPQTGEWENKPGFFDCKMWGNRAAKLAEYLHKGSSVTVNGKLELNQWESDGQKRSKVEINVNDIDFHDKRAAATEAPANDGLADTDFPF